MRVTSSGDAATLDETIDYFEELSLRFRGNPGALVLVQRCLSILSRAMTADRAEALALDDEVDRLADDLALRFGAPRSARLH